MAEQHTTRLGRNWLGKMGIFLVVALVMGTWGLLDAVRWYPERGLSDASLQLSKFLEAADAARQLTPDQIGMDDPADRLMELRQREESLRLKAGTGSVEARQAAVDLARLQWLDALNKTWVLRRERVPIDVPPPSAAQTPMRATHFDLRRGVGVAVDPTGKSPDADVSLSTVRADLKEKWDRTPQPTPLASFDLYVQWLFVVAGYGCALWVLLTIVKAAKKKYRWQPQTQTLTMPDGKAVTPGSLKDIDKRKWHKFFCTVELNDGSAYVCDLLKYQPLEDWVLELERTAFPDRVKDEEAEEADEEASTDAPAPTVTDEKAP